MKQKKWILHVGFPRTATSSIHETLLQNRELLEKQGIHYPIIVRPGFRKRFNHGAFLVSLFSERPEAEDINTRIGGDIRAINTAYREQFEELLEKDCTVLVSAEHIAGRNPGFLEKMESEIRQCGWSIEVIASVRSPLSALASDYSEIVKAGSKSFSASCYRPNMAPFSRLKNLRSVFDTVRTYPFSKACGHTRGPVGHFLDFLRIDADAFKFFTKNTGFSINAIRLLEYINRHEPYILNGNKNPNRVYGDSWIFGEIPGPKFRLTREEYETVRKRIEFENAWLESNLGREYCDDEIELRRSDVHWDEEGLRAVRSALPEIPDVLVPYVHRYFEEERGIVLTQDAVVPGLPECRPALERPEEVVRSIDERLRAGQLD